MTANLDMHRLLSVFISWCLRLSRRAPALLILENFHKLRPQLHVTDLSHHSHPRAAPRMWNLRFIGPPDFSRDFQLPAQCQQPWVY